MKRVLVTGATGFIGRRLLREVLRRGDRAVALTRDRSRLRGAELLSQTAGVEAEAAAQRGPTQDERLQVVEGDPALAGPWQEALRGCDAVVALHGEPIAGRRWSADFKRRAQDSRVEGMRRIIEAITALPADERPRVLVGGSAVGYYGPHGDEKLTEAAAPGDDFLARLCVAWEGAASAAPDTLRVVAARIGIVLGPGGGVLQKMVPAFRAFVGGPIGSGRQWLSWIHLEDAVGLLLHLLGDEAASGPVNVTAPEPVTMKELAQGLGRALHRPASLPVPGLALRLLFGEGADPLLTGQRALPARALALGYRYRFPTLEPALADLLRAGP